MGPEGTKITKLEHILLNGTNICLVYIKVKFY